MRSLYVRVVAASFVAVAISLGAFITISDRVVGRMLRRLIETTYAMELDDAVAAYQRGGQDALGERLRRLDTRLEVTHFLTDASGRNLLTGADETALLATLRPDGAPTVAGNRFVFIRTTADGQFHLIATGRTPFSKWTLAPFYLIVLGSIVLISWWVTRSIVLPLRAVTQAADRFGQGDLSVRVTAPPGRSEIGTLAASFNGMAGRIETLLAAERRLLQDVSHELRSPLARLNFSAELARTAGDRDAAIDRIQTDLDRLSAIVTELIEMTRAEGDPSARRRTPVDLDELLLAIQAASAREAAAGSAGVTITGRLGRPLLADREILRWGIENVVRNALRYAPDGTDVDVQVHERLRDVEIVVRDFGPGVPADDLARIFEPFYRSDEARTPSASAGLGLGLAIAQRAVRVHRGAVHASNASPGLRVTIRLPLE